MHILTLSQKAPSSWLSWQRVFPLLTLLISLGVSRSALGQRFTSDNLTVSSSLTGAAATSTTYVGKNATTANAFAGKDLGGGSKFDQGTGALKFTTLRATFSGTAAPDPANSDPGVAIVSASFFYRVYLTTATIKPAYTEQVLNLTSNDTYTSPVAYGASNLAVDLLNQPTVLGGGVYNVDVYYQATYDDGSQSNFTDPGNGATNPYTATFQVAAPAVTPNGGTTTWISSLSTAAGVDWLNAANWSNGVPNRFSDAIIPDKAPTSDFTVTPVLSDPTKRYEVKTLTLNGQTNSSRALLRIGQSTTNNDPVGVTLRVYGDLNNYAGGVLGGVIGSSGIADSTRNSTIVFARSDGSPQAIRGLLSVTDIRIEGSGIKAVIDEIDVPNTLSFSPKISNSGALLRTAVDNADFDLKTTQTAKVVITSTGLLIGETSNSYIQGVVISERTITTNIKQDFGNIGLDITANLPVSGTVKITRTVGDPLTPPSFPSKPQPIKRQYGVTGDVNNSNIATIVFHYLNSTDELNGNPEQNLTIFKTSNNGPPYTLIGRDGIVDLVNHTVTRNAYQGSLNTITLGDEFNPLPIELVSFNAVRSSANTLISWTTASELNNKGFNVQVSTDGINYHTLAFVVSQSPNSSATLNYKYADIEAGKVGIRYYRLEQVDIDGKLNYSPVRAVNFDGAAATSVALVAYPNPFTDSIGLTVTGTATTEGIAYITLVDMTGRKVLDQKVSLNGASLALGDLSNLRSGLYLAKVTLPDGTTQTVRMQKQ
ncbi:MAG: T9SS type A sorting domain-containing protein [Janthinobacterium lividum]